MTTTPAIKITAAIGALILLITAAFHMTGLADVTASVTGIERELFREGLPGMWAMLGVHWIFIAFLAFGLSRYKSKSCAAILTAFGVWLLVDALIIFKYVGAFVAVYMIGTAGLFLLVSGLMLRKFARLPD